MEKTKRKKCIIKKRIEIDCPTSCKPRKLHPCKRKKKKKVIVKKVVRLRCPTPQVNVPPCPPPPDVVVNPPAPIVIPAPIVNIEPPEDVCVTELQAELSQFIGQVIEVIDAGGAGAGGNPPNRIGVLEAVGAGTFAIRPTTGNPANNVVFYSICEIIGFRPAVTILEVPIIG